MRKIILLLFIAGVQSIYAKTPVGQYTLSYFDRPFRVEAGGLKNGGFSVYIEVKGEDTKDAFIMVESKNLNKLKSSLSKLRDKYTEWSSVAKENGVSKMTKEMDVKIPPTTIYWETPSRIHISANNKLYPVFSVLDDGSHTVIIAKTAKSAFNQFITENIYWVFSSADEIDELLAILDEGKIAKSIKGEGELLDLFK